MKSKNQRYRQFLKIDKEDKDLKFTFHPIIINNPFYDPCVFVNIIHNKRALLFDIGDIRLLQASDIMKISDIFVTHMHIDHFIGFDVVLRYLLKREIPLRIFGPENIISAVEGKLRGYTWNLIKEYPLKIEVFEIKEMSISQANFYAQNEFKPVYLPESGFDQIIFREPLFYVKALNLTHGIPIVAYCLEEDFYININKIILSDKGFPIGKWLSYLKTLIRQNYRLVKDNGKYELILKTETYPQIEIEGKVIGIDELMDMVIITKGQKICYAMDLSPSDENIQKITEFVRDADIFFCETYFLDKDKDRAFKRNHLTAKMAGRIAKKANVGNLKIMHFSPKYKDIADEIYKEAETEFKGC